MLRHPSILLVLLTTALVGCDSSGAEPHVGRHAIELQATPDERRFLLGRDGILDELDTIEAGGKLQEKWTLVSVKTSLLPFDAQAGDVDLSAPGVTISHEFDADDPYTPEQDVKWFRFDFETSALETSGSLAIDTRSGENNGVTLSVHIEGNYNLYEGPEPIYVVFEIVTGMSFAN